MELGRELRRLRESRGETIEQVSAALSALYGNGFSMTKISRLETGKRPVSQRDVRDLCDYYDVPAQDRAHMMELAKISRTENRWQGMAEAVAEHYALESVARTKRIYEPMLVPGLLQTAEYTRSLAPGNDLDLDLAEPPNDDGPDHDAAVSLRSARQRRLTDANPLRLHVIIDENVVRRMFGGREVMLRQLQHLVDMSILPNITLQIIPYSQGAYTGMESAGFAVLEFEPGTQDRDYACFVEGAIGAVWAERESDRQHLLGALDRMGQIALSPEESRELLKAVVRELS